VAEMSDEQAGEIELQSLIWAEVLDGQADEKSQALVCLDFPDKIWGHCPLLFMR
jgi:hypothetical protein